MRGELVLPSEIDNGFPLENVEARFESVGRYR